MKRRILLITILVFVLAMVVSCVMPVSASAYHPYGVEVTDYDPDVDYMSKMYAAAKDGSELALQMGAIFEQQRNLKIEAAGSLEEYTFFFKEHQTAQDIKAAIEARLLPITYDDYIVTYLAEIVYGEARGIASQTTQACIIWTALNRVDAGYGTLEEVITTPEQFWRAKGHTIDDYGRDLKELARDVLARWYREKAGWEDVGRVLPKEYKWYGGSNGEIRFRDKYKGQFNVWDYSLGTPYES